VSRSIELRQCRVERGETCEIQRNQLFLREGCVDAGAYLFSYAVGDLRAYDITDEQTDTAAHRHANADADTAANDPPYDFITHDYANTAASGYH